MINNSFIKTIFISFSLIHYCGTVIGQDESNLTLFKKSFEHRVREKVKTNEVFSKVPKGFKVIIVPVCKVDANRIGNKTISEIPKAIVIDSSRSSAILQNPRGEFVASFSGFHNLAYSFLKPNDSTEESKFVGLIVRKYPQNPFLVSFSYLNEEKALGYYEKGKCKFVDSQLHHQELEDLIIRHSGTVVKFWENIEWEKTKIAAAKAINTPDAAGKYLQRDYVSYGNTFRFDTIRIIDLLIQEVNRETNVSNRQLYLLKEKIPAMLELGLPFCGSGIPLLGVDVNHAIETVLTDDQYIKYLRQRKLNSWVASEASRIIFFYLHAVAKVPLNQMDNEFRKFVYGR